MRAEILPCIFVVTVLLATGISYGISVSFGHVPVFLPYISDTGVFVPERSVFSLLINLAAFIHVLTVYVRFEQVRAEIKWRKGNIFGGRKLDVLNKSSLLLGLGISLGLSLIGNFQLHTQRTLDGTVKLTQEEIIVQKIHWLGAFLTYVGGIFWMGAHTILSIILSMGTKKGQWRRRTAFLRILITIATFVLIILGVASGLYSAMHSDEETGSLEWKDNAKTSDSDFRGRFSLTSVICEWTSTLLILIYAITLIPELRLIRILRPQVTIVVSRYPQYSENHNTEAMEVQNLNNETLENQDTVHNGTALLNDTDTPRTD